MATDHTSAAAGGPKDYTGDGAPFVYSGDDETAVEVPCDFEPPERLAALERPGERLLEALARPLGTPPLTELARGAGRVAVAVPDATRPCPTALLLPPLLEHLAAAGVADEAITVVVGCGVHRSHSEAERRMLVGDAVADRVAVIDAQGLDGTNVLAGETADGREIWLDATVATADLVVAVGIVEPHLYAGFSGGPKAVAIGCGGAATIAWTHDPVFLDRPAVRLGVLDGNPFAEALREIAGHTNLAFAVNVVVAHGGGVADLAAGDPAAVQRALSDAHRGCWLRSRPGGYDLLLAGVPAPKHESLYQATRAATYAGLAAHPAVADGGLIAICADLPLGAGDGPGELNFGRLLTETPSPMALVERGCTEPLGPGGQRAYMVAKLMLRYRLAVVGAADPAPLRAMGLLAFETVEQAVAEARRIRGAATRILAVADGIDTVVEGA